MARKKAAANGTASTEQAPTTQAEERGTISKADAVRQALAEGVTKPQEGAEFIKSRFGLDITPGLFSVYKGNEKRKGGKKRGRKPGRTAAASQDAPVAAAPKAKGRSGEGDLVGHVEAIRAAVASLGADQVKRLAELFA